MNLRRVIANALVRAHLETGALIRMMEKFAVTPSPMYVLYPRNRHLSARIRTFVEWIAEVF